MIKPLAYTMILITAIHSGLLAQGSIVNCTDSTFCVPSVVGLPRSKGVEIKREITRDYGIRSESDESFGDSQAEVLRNRRWSFMLRLPVVMKDNITIAAGVKYFVEEFNFEDSENLEYPFYQNLENRSLRSIRGDVFVVKPTRTNKYFLLRLSGGLNGDYTSDAFSSDDFLRFSIAPLIGWKKNDYVSYAVGLAYSYNFGRRTIYPLFAYNKTFNNQWGFESVLPAEAKLRYSTLNQKNYLYLKAELNGANYSLRLEPDDGRLMYLDKSEVRTLFVWEREIHDWLWFSLEAGMQANINFDLSNSPNINSEQLVDNRLREAFTYGFSIFIVPPRRLLE